MILAGDIGGTKTILAVFSSEVGPRTPLVEKIYPSARYASLEVLIEEFLAETGLKVIGACLGVAGPVVAGRANITNLPWVIEQQQLQAMLHLPTVHLLNDLEAIAWGVPVLEPTDVHTLNVGRAMPGGTIAVIAPGTGLGEAFLTWDGTGYRAYPSEGGHVSFAPTNTVELDMLRYLLEQFSHVSYERICSGWGLPNIYAYFRNNGYGEEVPEVLDQLAQVADPTPVIVSAALDPTINSELCRRTLDMFVAVLGAEAGNLGLKMLATGGVYIGGGIPPRILPCLEEAAFLRAFRHKGRFAELLADIPVHVILNPKTGLLGVAHYGLTRLALALG